MRLIAALLLATGAGAAAPGPNCATVAGAVPAGQVCRASAGGLVIAGSPDRAVALATLAEAGAARFRLRFGRAAPAYAVVETGGAAIDPALAMRLAAAGIAWRLPWLSEQAMSDALTASVTRAVDAKAAELHLDAAAAQRMKDAALAQRAASTTPEPMRAREAATLPHELGHGWFIKAYWPTLAPGKGDHYGGPAPDWMDEAAAVMMEDDATSDHRRAQFAAAWRGSDAAAKARLGDLATFLSGGHPALPALNLPAGTGGGVRVLTGEEAQKVAAVAGGFYLTTRLFADYVVARSGDPAAFHTAAEAFARGDTPAQWLAASGPTLHLPTTIAALQADWERWLDQTLPATRT